jgi:hypothetical protein
MQNEETPTEVNPFMDIAAGMSKPPAAPTMPTDNPFMDLAPAVRTVSQPPAVGSLSAVAGINPDQAAEATKLGTPLGIGQDLALRNMDELRRRSMIASVQRSGMLQNNPRLAQSLLDPVFAAQAHDDLDSLEKTSSLFDKAVNFIGPELFDRRPGQALRIAKVLEDGYAIGELGAELGALKSRRKGYVAFGGTPENETVLNDRIAFLEKQLANKEPSGFFGSAAMVTAQALAMARPVGTVALMGAGVGGAVGGPPGAAAGFVAGLQAGIVGTSAQVEGGFLFDDMVAQGVEPETAYYASVAGGTVIGIIELVGDRLFAGSFKPITRFLRQELTQQLAKPTIRSAAAEFGKQTLKQMAVGGAEEGSQRLVADAFSELGKAIDGVPTDFTWSQMAKNIASDFAAGVQGSALIGAAGPGLSLMVDVRRAEAVSAQEEFFDGLDAAKKDGKLPKRNLDAYEGFLARQAKGTTADTVYVEAEAAAQVLAQSGLSAEQLEQSIPGIREQLRNALENGGDVTIPTSVYGARLAGTSLGDALRPHVRLSPEAMSVAQAQDFSRKRDALRQEAQAALAERQEADAAFVESAQKVETTVAEQLRQTGMQDIEVRANAELFRDLAVTQAARMGITPEQFYERYPYRVRGPQVVQEGQPLEQAAQMTLADVEQSFADLGVEQRLTETSTTIRPGIIRVPAELRDEGRATRAMQSLIAYADQSGKRIDVSPTSEFGASKKRLIAWYKRLGFVENKGSNKDFAISATMYRLPSAPVLEQASRIDADYLAAVERGDMETAQRMVDEAAKASGLTEEVWRGDSRFNITEYAARRRNEPGIFTTYDERVAKDYAADGDVRRFYVGGKTLDLASRSREAVAWIQEWAKESGYDFIDRATGFEADPVEEYFAGGMWDFEGNGTGARWKDIQRTARAQGYDIVRLRDSHYSQPMTSVVVLNENKIKLADPVTRDEAGNVVPLSRRFNITSPKVFEQAAMFEQAPVSPGFYSALAKAVDAIDAKSLAPSGWKERIKGLVNKGEVKQDEVDWSGLTDWLDMQDGKVTKEAVAEFLKNNGVRVKRVQRSGKTTTKFGQYTLPGGTNYREVLIMLPRLQQDEFGTYLRKMQQKYGEDYVANMTEEESARLDTLRQRPAGFRSSHWKQPNVLVHFRLNDRVDADGKRVLFVEEIQSDWGQAGRKKGFASPMLSTLPAGTKLYEPGTSPYDAKMAVVELPVGIVGRSLFYGNTIDEAKADALAFIKPVAVPLAPFVETTDGWLNLGLKHILLEATQGNYDRVAFVNGKQSADRYDLSKQVSLLSVNKQADGRYLTYIEGVDGSPLFRNRDGFSESGQKVMTAEELADTVGKDVAEQTINGKPNKEGWVDVRGDGLKVGGRGMIDFYDKIVPASVNKLLKKYGGGKMVQVAMATERRVTNDEIMAAERRGDWTEAERLTAIMERQELGRGEAPSGATVIGNQPGLLVTPEMVKKLESGLPLFQAARAPRGEFDPAKLMTTLREGRDFSTFAHETAHFYLTILADIARSATGPQQTKADMDALLTWFGIEGATPAERLAKWSSLTIDQQRQYHEQFAYSFEIYLHEGKAPSVEMQSLFNQFAAWLKRVYKSIRDELNATYKAQFGRDLPMMSSEIRLVMDRMLATDEQIARAQVVRGMKAMFQTQEQSGMNDAEWAAYQALEQDATDAATAELTKATLKELQWYGNAQSKYLREIQAKHDRARKEIREEVSAQVQLEPVYRAMEFLKKGTIRTDTGEVTAATGAFKLDLAKVRAIMPAGFDPASLKYGKYGMVQEGGIDPDMAAGMFGYGSGVEFINAILGAKPIKEEIDARTDQRMLDENSDLATPEARQAAVDMAIHNEARARFIAVEQRWLEKQRRPANDMLQAARQVAQDIIGGVVIRTLNPRRYEAAEAEAARTATTAYREPQDPSTAGQAAATRAYNEAIAAGQTPDEATVAATEAGVAAVAKAQERRAEFDAKYGGREPAEVARRAKRQQLVQNQLAREAMLAKEEIAVAGRDFSKFFRSDEKLAKTRDMAPIMAARAILSYYGYGKRGESPAQYLDQLRTYAPDLYDGIAPIVLKSLSGTNDYRDLTVTEFRVLRDTVQALWAQARRDRQITVDGERVALDLVLKEMADRLQAIGVGERVGQRQAPGAVDQANRHLLGLRAMMSRVEAWADALDGMAGPGAFTKYLFRPVKQAVDAYRIERNKYVERFVKLLDGIDLTVGKIAAPELDYTFGNGNGGIGRAELLGALMHTGNDGNYRKLLLGRGWGELDADGNLDDSRWRSFIARMIAEGKLTKSDYDFVQSIWDLLEEIKPLAQRAHFDMYGYYFKEVEATEVVTPFGTYRGGYVPAATDKFMVQDARVNASMDELEGDWRNSLPSTGAGFTKGRVDYNEALSLDLRLIATHTDAVLRFSMIQPSVKDALKILRDRDLKALLERFDPAVMENMLLPWLNRAARQQAMEPGRWKLADKFWGGVRSRAGVATMFANLRNALQQFTGWFPSLLKVKRRYLQSALMTYLGSPKQTAEAVAVLSPFMADRMRNQMFELQGTMNELLLNPSKYEKLQQWSSKHGYFLQQAFQNMVDVTTWHGAYNQALAEGETQTEAVARGDAAVRLTQGSLSPEDLSMFEVGTPFYRTFVQFTGYFNMLANLNLGEFQKTVRDMGWRSGKGRLLYIYVMGMLLPAIVSDAIVRSLGGGWDDEDEDGYMDVFMDWFFGSQVRMGAALLPFGSTAYTAITTAFNDKPYDDRITTSPSIAALESATIGTSKAIIAVTDEDKDVTGRNVRDVLTLITLLTGVPVSALGRPAGYLIDVERGEIEPESGYDMIRGMITGTATPESKR